MQKNKTINDLINVMFSTAHLIKVKLKGKTDSPSFLQMGLLRFVSCLGSPTMKEIADYLSVSAPSATTFIENLIKNELLERVSDQTDRRVIRVKLSTKGAKVMEHSLIGIKLKLSQALARLNQEELDNFHKILNNLNNNLK